MGNKKIPFVSIVIPTFNRGHFIQATLQSCLQQDTSIPFEVIVIDDGSTDDTERRVAEMKDSRIRYFKKSNGERGAARNFGVHNAQGIFVSFLDSDDLLYPNYIQTAYLHTILHPDHSIFHLGYEIKSQSGTVHKKYLDETNDTLNDVLLKGNFMSCMGVFVKRSILSETGFSENRDLSGSEDWLLWLKLSARHKIFHIPIVSASMIDHDARSVKSFSEKELLLRTELMRSQLEGDQTFVSVFGKKTIRHITAHMYTYSGLHLILSGQVSSGWTFYWKGLVLNPKELFTRRTLAIIKHTLS